MAWMRRSTRLHKSCHRRESLGDASNLFCQQTKASFPANIGTSCFQFHSLISPPCPAVCVSCVLGVENEGDDPLDWLRSSIPGEPGTDYPIMATTQVSVHYIVVVIFISHLFRTVASLAMVSCLAVTTPTPPRSANSTASACRTPSAQTPSTRSTSSAPTAPSSTSSSSTAIGGQCLSCIRLLSFLT